MADLFSASASDDLAQFIQDSPEHTHVSSSARAPLAVRMRPRSLEDILGQNHILAEGSPLRVLVDGLGKTQNSRNFSSVILHGPPGTGKTTLAHVIAQGATHNEADNDRRTIKFVELSALTAGVKDVRNVMDQALFNRDMHGITTVLFLDEIHRFNKSQQDALLQGVENGWVVLVAATTENPVFSLVTPLLSRSLVLKLNSLEESDIKTLIYDALISQEGLKGEFTLSEQGAEHIARLSNGDARKAMTTLEAAATVAYTAGRADIRVEDAELALNTAAVRYDRQAGMHYDVASAFIKSMRGSDVDAALHYVARMIEGGEDPRFIARRIMIFASEDIGMADSSALSVAVNAAQAVALVGMPEAQIILGHAVTYMATAPKSNASYKAINAAISDVKSGKGTSIPNHIRDQHYYEAPADQKVTRYKYAHDAPNAIAAQQYLPDDLLGHNYYEPTQYGHEKEIGPRVEKIRKIIRSSDPHRGSKEPKKSHKKK